MNLDPNGQKTSYFCLKAKLLQLKLIQVFARAILLMKKLEIEKTKSTLIISVLKVEIGGLSFFDFQLFHQ